MLEPKPRPTVASPEERAALKTRQSQRLLFALLLLLVALVVVVVTDRHFWFGSNQLILDGDESQPAVAPAVTSAPSASQHSQPVPTKKHVAAANSAPQKSTAPVVAVNRTVLPPLNVEIVAGGVHRATRSNTSKIEIANPAPDATAVTDAAGRERITADAAPQVSSYPLLAQHMNVQGSVVLKAIIGADGIISDLHILSGPAILAAAAQQAVREWHFKPVLQNGQPVETMAKIVVNFSIKIADNSEKTTLAESRADGLLIFTR
jgi:protein TonB